MSPRNPNFDPAVRTGWDQFHCEDYQILNLITIHGSKSKLERPRYHENRDNTLIDAPLTSVSYNFWSDHWIFKFHIFLKTGSQDLSKGVKINPIQDHLEVAALEPLPRNPCRGYKRPQAPSKPKNKNKNKKIKNQTSWVLLSAWTNFELFFFLPNTHTYTKHIKGTWFFSSPKIQGIVLIPNLHFLGSTPWIWGLEVWM